MKQKYFLIDSNSFALVFDDRTANTRRVTGADGEEIIVCWATKMSFIPKEGSPYYDMVLKRKGAILNADESAIIDARAYAVYSFNPEKKRWE